MRVNLLPAQLAFRLAVNKIAQKLMYGCCAWYTQVVVFLVSERVPAVSRSRE